MAKQRKVPKNELPIGLMCGVVIALDRDSNTWSAWVRKQLDSNSYQDVYLEAPSLSSLEVLLRIYKPYGSNK